MLPLYDVTAEIGGLQVVPKSHILETKEEWKKSNTSPAFFGDFCVLKKTDPWQKQAKLLLAQAGDLIVWDSRTVHGGLVGPGYADNKDADSESRNSCLARLSQTICMVPRSKANLTTINKRKQGFEEGKGYSHWPHQLHVCSCYPKAWTVSSQI
jgi:ectoine hydroxylase-related dioxygenase (phytanoyl-CoA dioxygenase family)